MEDFLNQFFNKQPLQKKPLPGDGGHRCYTKIITKNGPSYILMISGRQDASLKEFLSVQKRLEKSDCLVPKIFQHDLRKGLALIEDLGDQTLEQFHIQKGIQKSKFFYKQALRQLITLQTSVEKQLTDIVFNKKFFMNEVEMSLKQLGKVVLDSSHLEKLESDFLKEIKKILIQVENTKYFYCHRDFHSRNMMVCGEQICLLDFQDAGIGPQVYDLTSLLYDSYIVFTDLERQDLTEFYFKEADSKLTNHFSNWQEVYSLVQIQFLQRGLKACGCFAKFYNENKKNTHLKYITPTFTEMLKVSQKLKLKKLEEYFYLFLNLWDETKIGMK